LGRLNLLHLVYLVFLVYQFVQEDLQYFDQEHLLDLLTLEHLVVQEHLLDPVDL
jgi:hypothetical protein